MEPKRLPVSAPRRVATVLALAIAVGAAQAAGQPALRLVATIRLPNVEGRIDHMAADVARHRLFVAALGNGSVEVLDTSAGRRVQSIAGFTEPQGIAYLADPPLLYVADGGAGRVDILDGKSLMPVRRIENLEDADNVRYDPVGRLILVGYGNGALRRFDAATGDPAGRIALSGHPESFQLERNGSRIFVNVPAVREVAVLDRATGRAIAAWRVAERANFPMALDETLRRLYVATRSPPALVVYDTDSGLVAAKLPIGRDADDVFLDRARSRLYVICGDGRIEIVRREDRDQYRLEASTRSAPGARTGLFVAGDRTLYVAAPARRSVPARVLVFRAN